MRTTTRYRRPTVLLVCAVALPLGTAACSSASSANGPTTTRAAGHQGTTSICSLVTPAQIESTLGRMVRGPGVTNSTAATTCTYPATDGRTSNSVILTYRGHVTAAAAGAEQAALGRLHGTLTPVTVSSGQAFSYTSGSGAGQVTSLLTLIGQTQVTVAATATLDQLENLTQQIFTAFATGHPASTTTTTGAATG